MEKDPSVARFLGLNNVDDPLNLGLEWLTTANNIVVTDAGRIKVRDGYAEPTGGVITGAYGTLDHRRAYFVDDGALKAIDGPTLATGLASARMHWAEVNDWVYYCNGIDTGIISADNTRLPLTWPVPTEPALAAVAGTLDQGQYQVVCTFLMDDGRETGAGPVAIIDLAEDQALQISSIPQASGCVARVYIKPANSTVFGLAYEGYQTARLWDYPPESLGVDMLTDDLDPIPAGADVIQIWRGRLYAAQYMSGDDMTALWFSQPLGHHLFNLQSDFLAITGRVLFMAPHDGGLVIGTDQAIHVWDGESLSTLAEFGTVPGCAWSVDDSRPGKPVYFWTTRGMCRFPEFANLTEQVSVAPGLEVGAAVMHVGGQRRFVAALHSGGSAFNDR